MKTFRHNRSQQRGKQNYSRNKQITNYNRNNGRCYECANLDTLQVNVLKPKEDTLKNKSKPKPLAARVIKTHL